jgi:uncharacterized protein YndB with AHSA1/START domain
MTQQQLAAIEKTVELSHSVNRVWRAISDASELAQWFPNTSATLDLRPGGVGHWVWDIDEGHFEAEIHVEVVEPPHRLVWTWGHEAGNTDPVTRVEWLLSERPGGGTTLLVRETGFLDEKRRSGNVEGWDSETAELVAYLDR